MADSRLTDLPAVTQVKGNDIFYVVDVNDNISNNINFNDLANSLLTNSDSFSAGLVKQVDDNKIDIEAAQEDIIDITLSATDLRTDLNALSTNFEISTESDQTSTISFGTINVPSNLTIANNTGIITYYNIPQLSAGDTFDAIPVTVGGLSGVFTNSYSLSDNGDGTGAAAIFFYNVTGVSVNIPTTIDFKYIAERILF